MPIGGNKYGIFPITYFCYSTNPKAISKLRVFYCLVGAKHSVLLNFNNAMVFADYWQSI
jgi:hypothetical protein